MRRAAWRRSCGLCIAIGLVVSVAASPGTAQAAPPTISAGPDTVFVGPNGKGPTTISWSTGDGSHGEIWVSVEGADEVVTAGGPSGSHPVDWIQLGTTVFTLRESGQGAALASVEVEGVKAGTISASDEHLVVPEGGTASTTIDWAMHDGSPAAHVWVSVNGDAPVDMAGAPSGSSEVDWIQRGTTTFLLYRGVNSDELIDTLVVTGSDGTTGPDADPIQPDQVGINYWPTDVHNVQFLNDENWPGLRDTVARDLDQIASLGGSVLRTNIHPELGGYFDLPGEPTDCSGAAAAASDWCEQIGNLPDFLSLAAKRGLKVIIPFSNSFLSGAYWQMLPGYGQMEWPAFTTASIRWMNGYIDAVEESQYADTVLYYDFQPESSLSYEAPNVNFPYLSRVLDGTSAPPERRGASVLRPTVDGPALERILGHRRVAFVDIRTYEAHTKLNVSAPFMTSLFPGTNIVLAEFGKPATNEAAEPTQADFLRESLQDQEAAPLPLALFWELYDDPNANPVNTGFGTMYDSAHPKDVLGVLCDAWSLISNCDMEATGPGGPTGMAASGAGATLSSQTSGAVVGAKFARVTGGGSSGDVGVFSDRFDVPSGRLFANAFVRSSAPSAAIEVREFDGSDSLIETTRFDPASVGPADWVNLLQESPDATSMFLDEDTESVSVGVVAPNAAVGATLDVDALMAGVRDIPLPPAAPTITGMHPTSPAASALPKVKGTASAGTVNMEFFKQAGCAGSAIPATGSAFEAAGVTIPVAANQTTQLSARAFNALGYESDCSNSVGYTHNGALAPPSPNVTFGPSRIVSSMSGMTGGVTEIKEGDMNDDGVADVVVTRIEYPFGGATQPLGLLVGDGHGGFADGSSLFEGPVPRTFNAGDFQIADFNGDGRNDVFAVDFGYDGLPATGYQNMLVLSTPGGKLVDATANLPQVSDVTGGAASADVDGDDDVDIFINNFFHEVVPSGVMINDGTGHFVYGAGLLPPEAAQGSYGSQLLIDTNGDDAPDLVLGAFNDRPRSEVLLNDGSGHFTALPDAMPPKEFGPTGLTHAMAPLDINRDGFEDLIVGYTKNDPFYYARRLQVLIANGDGTFSDETASRLPDQEDSDVARAWPKRIRVADLNADGRLDFSVSSPYEADGTPPAPALYLDDGTGVFRLEFGGGPRRFFTFLDANSDGRPDIFSMNQLGDASTQDTTLQLQATTSDRDGDGFVNGSDNCPDLANFDQANTDGDTQGNACDATPNGTSSTPSTPAGGSTAPTGQRAAALKKCAKKRGRARANCRKRAKRLPL